MQRCAWATGEAVFPGARAVTRGVDCLAGRVGEHHPTLVFPASRHHPAPTASLPSSPPVPVQLFETAIERACAAGTPAAAQSAFDHMCHAGVPPSAATFAALLGALRCQLPPAEAAEAALALSEQADAAAAAAGAGATPGRALAEAHAACASRGWFDLSLELLAATEAAGGAPTLEAVNAALVACAAGGAVAEVRQLAAQAGAVLRQVLFG